MSKTLGGLGVAAPFRLGRAPARALPKDAGRVNGGANVLCWGTVYALSAGLGPFVETEPPGGKVGAAIKILGTDLTDPTNVTFNGTPAVFTVEGSAFIRATVPAGATTGTVRVVTPNGTLSSNVPLRVAP